MQKETSGRGAATREARHTVQLKSAAARSVVSPSRRRVSGNPFAVRWSKFPGGERMPFLIRSATGVPVAAPTYWILSRRRPSGNQANTLHNDLRALLHLYLWAEVRGVSIEDRLESGALLTLAEIADLDTFCGRSLADALTELPGARAPIPRRSKRVTGRRQATSLPQKRNRLTAIHSFLEHASADFLSQLQRWPDRWSHYRGVRNDCLRWIKFRYEAIAKPRGGDLGAREGLPEETVNRLRAVIEPDCPENPFEARVRFRNYLIVRLLLDLGIRRGELLGIYVSDCNLGGRTIVVHRRPDNPEDPRTVQPSSKTNARELPVGGRLAELLYEWIVHYRPKIAGARKHPFLIVDSNEGRPLSLSSVNKLIAALRNRVPGLPERLSAHVLRHCWNDAFSDAMDRMGVPEDQEAQWRARLMGWRNLESAKDYLRRTVRQRSDKALLEIQDGLDIPRADKREK